MKKRYLIIVGQLFQLMVAAHMKETLLKDGDVDIIIIAGNSAGLRNAYLRIKDMQYFRNVFFVDNDILGSSKDKIKAISKFLCGKYDWKPVSEVLRDNEYDQIISVSETVYVYLLWVYLNVRKKTELYIYDEGAGVYLGYNVFETCTLHSICYRLIDAVLALTKRPKVLDKFKGYYLFYPNLIQFQTKYGTYQIPKIETQKPQYRNFIETAFGDISKSDLDAKYIFFEENIEDPSIDDFSLIMKIAEKVGKDNIVVKLHPRRNVDRFSNLGIKVSKSTGIPWEAFLLVNDYKDKVIITISSNVAFSSRLYFKQNLPTIMLYKITGLNRNIVNVEKYPKYIEDFDKIFGDDKFFIPESVDELLKLL